MDKLVRAAKNTRNNWLEAFQVSMNIHGYAYYDMPDNLRYRYPAPGSCALAKHDHPNLYKRHWKTPFRDSNLNIRMKEKRMPWAEEAEHFISEMPHLDPTNELDAEYLKDVQPNLSDLSVNHPGEVGGEESLAALREMFGEAHAGRIKDQHYRSGYLGDYEHDYQQVQFNWRERGATGMESDPRMKQIFVELEWWIEELVGAKQISDGQIQMYKGTVKKWQVLDDTNSGTTREQVEQMQAAIQAPLPEELEMYEAKHSVPMKLPFNNENATAWRDEPKAIDSADFDPDFLSLDREKKKRYFLERYEKPKELSI